MQRLITQTLGSVLIFFASTLSLDAQNTNSTTSTPSKKPAAFELDGLPNSFPKASEAPHLRSPKASPLSRKQVQKLFKKAAEGNIDSQKQLASAAFSAKGNEIQFFFQDTDHYKQLVKICRVLSESDYADAKHFLICLDGFFQFFEILDHSGALAYRLQCRGFEIDDSKNRFDAFLGSGDATAKSIKAFNMILQGEESETNAPSEEILKLLNESQQAGSNLATLVFGWSLTTGRGLEEKNLALGHTMLYEALTETNTDIPAFLRGTISGMLSKDIFQTAIESNDSSLLERSYEFALLSDKYGNSDGKHTLGLFFQSGLRVPRDEVKASKLFLESAKMGNAEACRDLVIAHLVGRGAAQSDSDAYAWMIVGLALSSGDMAFIGQNQLFKNYKDFLMIEESESDKPKYPEYSNMLEALEKRLSRSGRISAQRKAMSLFQEIKSKEIKFN